MSLPPFDGTGWIAGMPGLPGGGTAPPPFTLTLTVTPPSPVTAGTDVTISTTASADPTSGVTLHYTFNGGAEQIVQGALDETSPTTTANTLPTTLLPPGSVYDLWAEADGVLSNHVVVTIAGTVADLRAFAEANSIDVPAEAKKADLIALIHEAAPAPDFTLTSRKEN